MLIETERNGPNLIVEVDGELDLETSPAFREVIEDKLTQYDSIKHLIIDLRKVNFIDSSGLGVILGRFKHLSQQGGRVSAIIVSEPIRRIFELSGLLKIIDIYPNRQEALNNSYGSK